MFMTTSILLGLLSAFTAAHAAPTDMAKRGNAPEIKVILQGAKVTRVFEQSKTPEYSGKESEGWGNDKERTVPAFTGGKYAMYLTLDVGGPMLYRVSHVFRLCNPRPGLLWVECARHCR